MPTRVGPVPGIRAGEPRRPDHRPCAGRWRAAGSPRCGAVSVRECRSPVARPLPGRNRAAATHASARGRHGHSLSIEHSGNDRIAERPPHQAPNHPGVLNELGVLMLGRGAAEQAYALFVRATDADPRHPSLWANLASSLKALGRRAEEMDALEKALQLEPRHLSALL